jgi:hypothetical protein
MPGRFQPDKQPDSFSSSVYEAIGHLVVLRQRYRRLLLGDWFLPAEWGVFDAFRFFP